MSDTFWLNIYLRKNLKGKEFVYCGIDHTTRTSAIRNVGTDIDSRTSAINYIPGTEPTLCYRLKVQMKKGFHKGMYLRGGYCLADA